MSGSNASVPRWYEEAFRADYRRVYEHRNLAAARHEAKFLVESGLGGRVLDLCCGFARHTLALLELGVNVFGLDLSEELLREAADLPNGERLRGRLMRGDALALPLRSREFDGVVNLFSSFGYFGADGDERMLAEVARVLRPGGVAWFDLMNPPFVRARLRPRSERLGEGSLVRERRELSPDGRVVRKDVELEVSGSPTRHWREEVRLYSEAEMRELLAAHGLAVEAVHGELDGAPIGENAPRLVLRARR